MGEVADPRGLIEVLARSLSVPFALPAFLALCARGAAAGESEDRPATSMIIGMKPGETHLDAPSGIAAPEVDRRLAFEAASLAIRYHFIEDFEGAALAENAQHLQALRARVRLDGKGRMSLRFGVFPGSRFGSGWNDAGWGTGDPRLRLHLKQLYLSVRPARGVQVEWGGLPIVYGESTEVTSYDYDGYMTGQRVTLREPKRLFFEEVSLTLGYLAGSDEPGFFDRLNRLADVNYAHLLATKGFGRGVRLSIDHTRHSGIDTLRQAAHLETPGWAIVDAIRFENYQRLGSEPGYGFNVYGQKRLHPRVSIGVGYARIDRTSLNSDRFPRGQRVYQDAHLAINSELSVTVGFTRAVGAGESPSPRTRLDVALGMSLRRRLEAVR